ncbi:MAG: hypothetical protein R3E46_02090 [Sedimenticolaceae bacterium]|nr:hypothetical protein [Chromatiaceae bacterium]MCP5439215.1 hypothetical protein [Chromatiaceae bacterium]
MSTISNDNQFREALNRLTLAQQRAVGARFVENVLSLSSDPRVAQVLAVAKDANPSEDAVSLARRSIKAASLEAHTRCGSDGEWTDQAGYFVARAAEACLEPEGRSQGKGPAWKAAMSARMARTCLAADSDQDSHDSESQAQYNILISYLDA